MTGDVYIGVASAKDMFDLGAMTSGISLSRPLYLQVEKEREMEWFSRGQHIWVRPKHPAICDTWSGLKIITSHPLEHQKLGLRGACLAG